MKRSLLFMILITGLLLTACAPKVARFQMQDKTAIDVETGVTWMKNANLPGKPLPWRADENVYSFVQNLNTTNYAGYADWRLPTKDEMKSLISYAKAKGEYKTEKIDTWPYNVLKQLGFQDVKDYGYWTATRESNSEIYIADLASGKVEAKPEDKPYCLWPVRGGR